MIIEIFKGNSFLRCESGFNDDISREDLIVKLKTMSDVELTLLYVESKHHELACWFQGFHDVLGDRVVLFLNGEPVCRLYEADFRLEEWRESGHITFSLGWRYLEEVRPAFSGLLVTHRG